MNIHAVVVDADGFRNEVQALVIAIEDKFDGNPVRCIGQPNMLGEGKTYGVLEETEPIIGFGEECPVLALVHAKEFLPVAFGENDFVGFLVKAAPRPVASSFDGQGNLVVGITQSRVIAIAYDIERGIHSIVAADGLVVLCRDIHDRQCAGWRHSPRA